MRAGAIMKSLFTTLNIAIVIVRDFELIASWGKCESMSDVRLQVMLGKVTDLVEILEAKWLRYERRSESKVFYFNLVWFDLFINKQLAQNNTFAFILFTLQHIRIYFIYPSTHSHLFYLPLHPFLPGNYHL
jgi:hypothetical protein